MANITEGILERTNFFTTDGKDIWFAISITTTTIVKMKNTRSGEMEDVIAGDDCRFEPVKVVIDKPAETADRKPARIKKKTQKASVKRAATKKSKYKGVSPAKPKKDGTFKWRAQVWDSEKKENINLGSFEIEELAAAFLADYKGDKAEAKRLRDLAKQSEADMVEQAENNPDRPTNKTTVTFICRRCRHKHHEISGLAPPSCDNCGDTHFTRED